MPLKLHEHAVKGKARKLKKLLEASNDVDAVNANGETALHHAVLYCKDRCIEILLAYGADPNKLSAEGISPLETATLKNHSKASKILLQNGAVSFTREEKMLMRRLQQCGEEVKPSRQRIPAPTVSEDKIMLDSKEISVVCFGRMQLHNASWLRHPVTLKCANEKRKDFRNNKEMNQALIRNELKFLCEIRHPNITRLLATTITTATNAMTLILDPIDGGSFADAIYETNEQFTTEYICRSVIKMAEALQFLHQGSIVHNFVNAQSMYRSENNVVLGDFIYAQKLDGNTVPISDITAQVPWMAPTQANGELPDRFSDIYSFGAVLWELIERRNPVHWTASAYTSNEEGLFAFPFDKNWPPALRNIVSFCLQPSPECRPEFQTIIELLNDEIKVLDSSDIDKTVAEPSQDMNKRETQPHLRGNKYSELAKGSMQLQEKLSCNELTLVRAFQMVDLAKTHQRKLWAKETMIAKQAERIFLSRNITAEKKEASMTILEEFSYPVTKNTRLENLGRFNAAATVRLPRNTTKIKVTEKLSDLQQIVRFHQRKNWSKFLLYEKMTKDEE